MVNELCFSYFFLLLVTSVRGTLVLTFLGCGLALLSYFSSHQMIEYIPGNISLFSLSATFIAAIMIGALFARDREIINAGRLSGMRMLASSIAHDLRTPLASIYLQAELQEIILKKIKNSEIRKDLQESLNKITRGIETSNRLISMQLSNIKHNKFNTRNFAIYSIQNLIERSLDDYPLKETQKSLIQVSNENNFSIWLEELAFKNLLWNLLKNSLEYIEEMGKGIISIWLEIGSGKDNFNYLHVRDTARGLYSKNFEKVFESFFLIAKMVQDWDWLIVNYSCKMQEAIFFARVN
ncbi:CAI-1 autoinducer sensor kinase/phosphatase CqsS [Legionella parisiensis]|uniref:histidine kinase n=1 Tax=Legionella parisiensis TaxID=45071 RepID=A0A1E5JLR4_9GAMM|nr:HAMP domain-containing sensor histidine kinase [Legionella parisiensis]OEH45452.1 CAI-1 autoinducer sensor kinase/phosphatase CqsS [Legionella parisiensis]